MNPSTPDSPAPEKQIRFMAIGKRLAMVLLELETGKWEIRRFLGRKERLRLRVDSNLVRPQQGPIGGEKRCRT